MRRVLVLALGGVLLGAPANGAEATRTHYYPLNGSYADVMGGPAVLPNGGILAASGYFFEADRGPSLVGVLNPSDYSIEIVFQIKDVSGYRKLIDFSDRASDTGLYNLSGALNFYPVALGTGAVFASEVQTHLVLTRDVSSGLVSGYVNGVSQWTFNDSASNAVVSATSTVLHLLRDDFVTGKSEASGGFVDRIHVFAGALTPSQVRELFEARAARLHVGRSLSDVLVSWTNYVPAYHLEALGLYPLGFWMPVTGQVTTNGLTHTVRFADPRPQSGQMFRLRRWPEPPAGN